MYSPRPITMFTKLPVSLEEKFSYQPLTPESPRPSKEQLITLPWFYIIACQADQVFERQLIKTKTKTHA